MRPRTPLFDPWEYYNHPDSASLRRGAVIVLVAALAAGIQAWWFANAAFNQIDIPAGTTSQVQSILVGQLVIGLIAALVGWLILAAILHFFLWFGQAKRGFGTTLAVVWESQVVSIAFLPLSVALLYLSLGQIPSDPEAAARMLEAGRLSVSPLLAFSALVSSLWAAVIQGAGFDIVHEIPEGRAFALAIGVGLVFYLIALV